LGLCIGLRVPIDERGGRDMKYNLVISRTYVTEIEVTADNVAEAWDWVNQNSDAIYEAEMEQCNVISEETDMREIGPSQNEAEELLDLASHIHRLLHDYRHVAEFVPQAMHDALTNMLSHTED